MRLAGPNRTEFYRLLERRGLTPKMFKPSPEGDAANPAVATSCANPP